MRRAMAVGTEGKAARVPDDGSRQPSHVRALHEAMLALAAPVLPEPDAVRARLAHAAQLTATAFEADDGVLVLNRDPVWEALLPGGRPGRDAVGLPAVYADGHAALWDARSDGVMAHVARTAEPLYIGDLHQPSPLGPFRNMVGAGFRAFASVP